VVTRREAAAQGAGDVNPVANFRPRPCHDPGRCRFTEQGEARGEQAVSLRNVASDDCHAVTPGRRAESAIKLLEPRATDVGVEREREDCGDWSSAHCGQIAEIPFEQLGADCTRGHGIVEVPRINHRIHRDQLSAPRGSQHRTVIAEAERRAR
jgi:hypothetical protein